MCEFVWLCVRRRSFFPSMSPTTYPSWTSVTGWGGMCWVMCACVGFKVIQYVCNAIQWCMCAYKALLHLDRSQWADCKVHQAEDRKAENTKTGACSVWTLGRVGGETCLHVGVSRLFHSNHTSMVHVCVQRWQWWAMPLLTARVCVCTYSYRCQATYKCWRGKSQGSSKEKSRCVWSQCKALAIIG